MKRARLNPRKLLVASAGVATLNYAMAAGCGGQGVDNVANLMAPPAGGNGGMGGTGLGSVANLVAPPPPMGGTGGGTFNPGPVANLVAPPPPIMDASVPGSDAAAPDAAATDAAVLDAG
jgi:hypothetical protein